ncbi:MAG: HAD-IA family hydrolase [Microthrixaceae bacterium]
MDPHHRRSGGGDRRAARRAGRRGVRLVGLSNFSTETFPWCAQTYPVFDRFDDIVLSGAVGVAKPDPAIYLLACERFGVAPHEALFFDDSPANVAGARRVGMAARRFTTAARARDDLVELGVLGA